MSEGIDSNNSQSKGSDQGRFPGEEKYSADEISLKDLLLSAWSSRRTIVIFSLLATLLAAAGATFVFFQQPMREATELEFRLEFDGVDRNEYPNGLKFTTSDMLNTVVLKRVYEENELQRFLKFSVFKAALAIIQTNDELRFLEEEYAAKLSDKSLTIEERERIEAEFLGKKKSALVPIYKLRFLSTDATTSVPAALRGKVLNDILRAWAEYAERVKGVNKYQLMLVSKNVISEKNLEQEDYFIVNDMLRLTLERIEEDITKIEELPGSKTMKVGPDKVSLSDLRYRVEDLNKFKLSPLVGLIRQTGIAKEKDFALGYLENRLFELQLESQKAQANVDVYETSLNQYAQEKGALFGSGGASGSQAAMSGRQGLSENIPAMIPQFGATFLDSLIQMAQENADMEFRQEITREAINTGLEKVKIDFDVRYYQNLQDEIKKASSDGRKDSDFFSVVLKRVEEIHKEVFRKIEKTIEELNQIYTELSRHNLNPESQFYSVTGPISIKTISSVGLKKIILLAALIWVLSEGAILIGVLTVNAFGNSPTVENNRKS